MCLRERFPFAIFFLFSDIYFFKECDVGFVDEGGRNGSCSLGAAIMKQMYVKRNTSDLRE